MNNMIASCAYAATMIAAIFYRRSLNVRHRRE